MSASIPLTLVLVAFFSILTLLWINACRRIERFEDSFPIKVGIVCMMRNPQEIHWWMEYHREMGVTAFFIRLEDSPHWESYLRQRDDVFLLDTGESDPQGNNYITQMYRQGDIVNKAIDWCVENPGKIDFLFHIDQDELLSGSFDFLRELDARINVLLLRNMEAQYDVSDPSKDAVCFNAKLFLKCWEPNSGCRSYANGKSGCRVHAKVRYHGPHMMKYGDETEGERFLNVPFETLHVKHFDSCTLGSFVSKFHHMDKKADKKVILFPLYLKNMELVKTIRKAYEDTVSTDRDASKNSPSRVTV